MRKQLKRILPGGGKKVLKCSVAGLLCTCPGKNSTLEGCSRHREAPCHSSTSLWHRHELKAGQATNFWCPVFFCAILLAIHTGIWVNMASKLNRQHKTGLGLPSVQNIGHNQLKLWRTKTKTMCGGFFPHSQNSKWRAKNKCPCRDIYLHIGPYNIYQGRGQADR